jgi:hypothetical protein
MAAQMKQDDGHGNGHGNPKTLTGQGPEKEQRIHNPTLLPLKAAAERLGVTPWCLRERVWAGDVAFVRFTPRGKLYFRPEDLDALPGRHEARYV